MLIEWFGGNRMKVILICRASMLYMPYVEIYEKIFKENKIDYEIINWDRMHIEDIKSKLKYRDFKIGHQRNYFDYLKFRRFVIKKIDENKYNKVIIFGIQLSYFLKNYILKN